MDTSKCRIALHAGIIDSWEANPERQREIEEVLRFVATEIYTRLLSGAKAVDAVEFAVSALEDCSLFNDGKATVLNKHNQPVNIDERKASRGNVAGETRRIVEPVPLTDLNNVGAIALDAYGILAASGSADGTSRTTIPQIGETTVEHAGIFCDDELAVVWYVS